MEVVKARHRVEGVLPSRRGEWIAKVIEHVKGTNRATNTSSKVDTRLRNVEGKDKEQNVQLDGRCKYENLTMKIRNVMNPDDHSKVPVRELDREDLKERHFDSSFKARANS